MAVQPPTEVTAASAVPADVMTGAVRNAVTAPVTVMVDMAMAMMSEAMSVRLGGPAAAQDG